MPAAARADEVFTALSDPTRRAVLELIGGHGEATASQLARELPVSRQAVQKHLSSLAAAGMSSIVIVPYGSENCGSLGSVTS